MANLEKHYQYKIPFNNALIIWDYCNKSNSRINNFNINKLTANLQHCKAYGISIVFNFSTEQNFQTLKSCSW